MADIRVAKFMYPDRTYGKFWIAYCRTHKCVLKRQTLWGTVTGGHPSWNAALHAALKHHFHFHPEDYSMSRED